MSCRVALGALCVGAVMLAPACGGGKDDASAEAEAEHRLYQRGLADSVDVRREGEWTRRGDILTTWVVVTLKESEYERTEESLGSSPVECMSVDISQRIDNLADVYLAVIPASDTDCEGTKPEP